MGYKSDVGLCLTENGKRILYEYLATREPKRDKLKQVHGLLNDYSKKCEDQESGSVAWFWENLKWYADYEGVSCIENLLQNLDDDDYLFIRIGESEDDTDYRGGFWENPFGMCLVRSIVFD